MTRDVVAIAVAQLVAKFGCRSVTMVLDEGGRHVVLGAAGTVSEGCDERVAVIEGAATVLISLTYGDHMGPDARREARIFAESAANTFACLHAENMRPPGAPRRILVVDDDDGIRAFVRHILQRDGATVSEAPNGALGVARARDDRPDLIVIDWMMPELDGLTAVSELRRDPRTAAIPIVMLSSRSEPGDEDAARSAGADEVLAKPFKPDDLLRSVERQLRRAGGPSLPV
jgi:CheY-like chemotaxis protein